MLGMEIARVGRSIGNGDVQMSNFTHRLMAILFFILAAPLLGACNTTEGFGQDVEAVGEAIEEEADEHTDD
jgi:predicted small secreted protein